MSSPPSTNEPQNARVTSSAFLGVTWVGTSISLCFVIFRLFVRIKSFRRLYADDYLVIAAWLMLLVNAVTWQAQYHVVYELYAVRNGAPLTPEFLQGFSTFLRSEVPAWVMFYGCLWTVKLSFLIFFKRLGSKVRGFKIWWWIVVVISAATWVTTWGTIQYECNLGNLEVIFVKCAQPSVINFEWITLHYNCAIDVITDALIITIPVLLLWNVNISIRQKLALLGIFSLTITTIIFSIIRVAVVTTGHTQADLVWLSFWGNIEMSIAVTVACLASFRQLFLKQSPIPRPTHFNISTPNHSETLSFWRRGFFSLHTKPNTGDSSPNTFDSRINKSRSDKSKNDKSSSSFEHIMAIPLTPVRVVTDVESGKSFDTVSRPDPVVASSLTEGGARWEV